MKSGIKIFAPASIGNVACGFDVLGLCLDSPGDEIVARLCDKPGIHIKAVYGDKGRLPLDVAKNTAGVAAKATLDYAIAYEMVDSSLGIELEIHKKMPFGSGLGSSSASAVGGAMAVNEFILHPMDKRQLLPFALAGEAIASGGFHADNVAPSLLGGVILVKDHATADVFRLPAFKGLHVAVVYPYIEILTKTAREILSPVVALKDAVVQSASLGGFIIGMYNSDLGLIQRSLNDVLVEPQRAQLIPGFYSVKEAALNAGALGSSISGAGPSVFALCPNSLVAENAAAGMQKAFAEAGLKSDIFISKINQEGAVKC